MIIKGAEPFLFKGNSNGILLIHGFTGSPAELLLLGEFLNRAGFTVLCARLAGHATTEQDLIRTTNADWFNSVLDGYSLLSGICTKIFVVGHSMGALLALKLSTVRPVNKLVTISTPIFVDEGFGAENLPPREKCGNLCVLKPRRKLKNVPPAVNLTYRKMPFISVHELFELISEVKTLLPKVTAPILIMHGDEDHTAQPRSLEFVAANVSSTDKILVKVSGGGHLLPLTNCRDLVFEEVLKFLR